MDQQNHQSGRGRYSSLRPTRRCHDRVRAVLAAAQNAFDLEERAYWIRGVDYLVQGHSERLEPCLKGQGRQWERYWYNAWTPGL